MYRYFTYLFSFFYKVVTFRNSQSFQLNNKAVILLGIYMLVSAFSIYIEYIVNIFNIS